MIIILVQLCRISWELKFRLFFATITILHFFYFKSFKCFFFLFFFFNFPANTFFNVSKWVTKQKQLCLSGLPLCKDHDAFFFLYVKMRWGNPLICVQVEFFLTLSPCSPCSPTGWPFVSVMSVLDTRNRFATNAAAQIASKISSSNLFQQK